MVKKYRPKKNDMVLVRWKDASTLAVWVENMATTDTASAKCMSVGIFVERKKGDIKIALSLNEAGHYGDVLSIPASQVIEIYKLIGEENKIEETNKEIAKET